MATSRHRRQPSRCGPPKRSPCPLRPLQNARERLGNLSEWALRAVRSSGSHGPHHRGRVSYKRLGPQRGPGNHHQDDGRAGGVARRHDRRDDQAGHGTALKEVAEAGPRLHPQLHDRRVTTVFVNLIGSTRTGMCPTILVPRRARRSATFGHLPGRRRPDPASTDEFGDTYGIPLRLHRRRSRWQLRTTSKACARSCRRSTTYRRSTSSRAGREGLCRVSPRRLAA